ncbi:MAG TPA: cytochrome P450 [Candidatus Binatia bacterium]|nr:cytochrome P450 [Candidatus Binatia bacterium]
MQTAALEMPSVASVFPPGPRTPRLWQSLRYALNPYGAVESARRYGDRYTVAAIGVPGRMVVFSDPETIKEIFMADDDVLRSGEATRPILGPILGWHSILVLDGARHLRERRLMGPPFHGERMHVYGRLMRESAARTIEGWPIGRPFPIHQEMQSIALDVILRAVFGVDQEAALVPFRAIVERFVSQATSLSAAFITLRPFQIDLGRRSPWGRFIRNRQAVKDALLAEILRRRTEGTAGRTDIMSLLVDARDEQGQPMRDEELLDEMFTLLMAGHETTATSLAWVFWHLGHHPEVVAELRAELARVVGSGEVETGNLAQLEYLDAVVKETMRLTPVVTLIARQLHAPARIGGLDLPAGTSVGANIYLTHRRPDLWKDPERFDPTRFLGNRPSPYTFFPFGGGVRRCIGAAMATYELKIVLAEVLSRVDLCIAPGYRMRPILRAITVAPSKGMPVVVERRRAA